MKTSRHFYGESSNVSSILSGIFATWTVALWQKPYNSNFLACRYVEAANKDVEKCFEKISVKRD